MKVPVKLLALAVAALAAVAASAAFATAFREDAPRPTLTMKVEAPLVLGGRGFAPAERVVVTVYGIGGPFTKKVSAEIGRAHV